MFSNYPKVHNTGRAYEPAPEVKSVEPPKAPEPIKAPVVEKAPEPKKEVKQVIEEPKTVTAKPKDIEQVPTVNPPSKTPEVGTKIEPKSTGSVSKTKNK